MGTAHNPVIKREMSKDDILLFSDIIKKNKSVWSTVKPLDTTKSFFLDQKLPQSDCPSPSNKYLDLRHSDDRSLSQWTTRKLMLFIEDKGYQQSTNAVVYNPMSFMAWHTNSNNVGYRHYYTFTNKEALFRYIDPTTQEIYTDIDNIGWTYRVFKITKEAPLWHTIWSEGVRFSFGFNSENI